MTTYYLRAEGVNMDNFIFDTHDISTIRGGSFLMREAFLKNEKKWRKMDLSIISLESNSGLFSFQTKNEHEPENVRNEVLRILDDFCEHNATFVVDYVKKSDDFKQDFQKLLAKNRWRQFNQITVRYPENIKNNKYYCDLNGVDPGYEEWITRDEKKLVSKSVIFRKKQGIELRQEFSEKILEIENLKFTDDLKSLAEDPKQGNLNGKMAFIYIDGNRFGSIRTETCNDAQLLTDFQETIQNKVRKDTLKIMLEYAQNHKDFKTKKGELRFEVLMWGGDEIEFVVPAWLGWRILTLFFNNKLIDSKFKGYNLTHSAGVVFCHANSPILHIKELAKKICNEVKQEIPRNINQLSSEHNLIGFIILDSIDQLYQKEFDKLLIIGPKNLSSIESNILMLKKYFSHNKIYSIENLLETDVKKAEDELEKAITLLPKNIRSDVTHAIDFVTQKKIENWPVIASLCNFILKEEE